MDQEGETLLSRRTPNYNSLNLSGSDLSPDTPRFSSPVFSSTPLSPSSSLPSFSLRRLNLNNIPLKFRPYLRDVLLRFFQFILILIFLFTFLTIFKYKVVPSSSDYSGIKFD